MIVITRMSLAHVHLVTDFMLLVFMYNMDLVRFGGKVYNIRG
jgi:hypothetical protein